MDTELKERKLKQLDTILAKSSQIERWRGIREFILSYNPVIKAIDKEFIESLNKTRDEQHNEYGASESLGVRQLMDMPSYLHEALITADPELLPLMNNDDRNVQKKIWRKLTAAFPEYKIARKI
jgi:oligoendopeptidase F